MARRPRFFLRAQSGAWYQITLDLYYQFIDAMAADPALMSGLTVAVVEGAT